MYTPSHTLIERDGKLYIMAVYVQLSEPLQTTLYWDTGVRFAKYAQFFPDEQRARETIAKPLRGLASGVYQDAANFKYHIPGDMQASIVENSPIPEPKQRGRKLPTRWKNGRWEKDTAKGWKPL